MKIQSNLLKLFTKRDPVKRELLNCLWPGGKKFNIELAKDIFVKRTGMNLHVASPDGLQSFAQTPAKIIRYLDKGMFPKEIKHAILGHGTGSTVNDSWVVSGTGEKVFDFIRREIPKGERALVCCCEETPKPLLSLLNKNKKGVGRVVHTELGTASRPAKIVESGRDEIIGDFARGKATYY